METKKAEQNQTQPINGPILPTDELKKLTDFFSILIQIDQRNKKSRKEVEKKWKDKSILKRNTLS